MSGNSATLPDDGRFQIDLKHNCLYFGGNLIDLDLQDFKVFRALYESSPAFLQVPEIIATAWAGTYVEKSSVHQSIPKIRKALSNCGNGNILWIPPGKRDRGYRLAWQGKDTERDRYISAKNPGDAAPGVLQSKVLSKVELTDTHLIALDIFKSPLWMYKFPSPVHLIESGRDEWRSQRIDMHGNGDRGILITARFIDRRIPDSMFYFSSNGNLEWRVDAKPNLLDHDGKLLPKAWAFMHVIVSFTSGGSTAWAALANHAGWSGCVLRINAQGKAVVQFANAGYVEWLCHTVSDGHDCLIVCGENNAYDLPFVAALGFDDPPCGSAPGGRSRYRYANGPSGNTRKYILFPRTELIRILDRPYGSAHTIEQSEDNILVQVEAAESGAHFRYHFTLGLEPKYVFPSGNYEFQHEELERAAKVTHPWIDCPEFAKPLPLKVWTPQTGWTDGTIRWRDNPWKENPAD
jgi:DNA-binding winged helix-turn-helix (wHTH) protein